MAGKKGQRTINIYAFFFSLVAFLFVLQLGTGLLGALMGWRYPSGMHTVHGFIGTFSAVLTLTVLFLLASQAGFTIITRAEADKAIMKVYNGIVIAVMLLEAVYVFLMYKNAFLMLPNALTIAATAYSLVNIGRSKYEVVKGTRAWRNEQARKEREELKAQRRANERAAKRADHK